ncbi:PAC2 family protein [Brachybacterium sp. p3-SID1565]|uniref:proteasome assembly chaperone family protein n=1 Tax=Brachybacterium sp. p3-SID1565 TaxID=2916046 RepID=UPI0021A7C34E|nr:PAC2 family protein [Brachybacterium sp. p3-SID1565]MCT1385283.1 PAC2 family protein [Brachybacterium sp. p3-SID1565]
MRDPRDLYSFESMDVLAAVPREGLMLVHALPGLVDAGNSCRIAATYLRDQLRHMKLVSFDIDELLDYRGSRPQAVFDGLSYTSVDIPSLSLTLMYDEADRPFLFLDGPEPDLQWKRFGQAVIDLVEYFEVERVVGMQAVPMAVPHTRPIGLFAHANDPSLLAGEGREDGVGAPDRSVGQGEAPAGSSSHPAGGGPDQPSEGAEIVVPASFGALLEFELGRSGHPAMGYAAQIPHYLTRTDFPAGALALLRRISDATGLELPLVDLGDLTDAATGALQATLAQNAEVRQIVTALEEQYDTMREDQDGSPMATTMDLPTADEIGDHFERFLADQDVEGPDDPRRL